MPQSMGLQRVGHDWVTELKLRILYKNNNKPRSWFFENNCKISKSFSMTIYIDRDRRLKSLKSEVKEIL